MAAPLAAKSWHVFPGNFTGAGIGAHVALSPLTANTWTQFSIPLSTILPCRHVEYRIAITIQLTSYGTTNTFYVDDIYFTAQPAPALSICLSMLHKPSALPTRAGSESILQSGTAIWIPPTLPTPSVRPAFFPCASPAARFRTSMIGPPACHRVAPMECPSRPILTPSIFANFMHVATNLGEQAFITVNYGSGTSNEAAAWVLNANVTNHCGFKYWEVGNEVYGTWEAGHEYPAQ